MKVFDDVEENNEKQLAIIPIDIAFTKDAIADSVHLMMEQVEEGGNELDTFTKCTALIEYLSNLKKAIQPFVEDELSKYDKGEVASKNGIKMSLSSSAAKYSCAHYDGWLEQSERVEAQTIELKRIEGLMKKAEGTAGIVDADTGEVVPPRIKVKEGASVVRATIPKS